MSSLPSSMQAQDESQRRRAARPTAAFGLSLLIHALILAVLAMVTWAVVRDADAPVVLHLDSGGGGGGGSGAGSEGAAAAMSGETPAPDAAARSEQADLPPGAAPIPAPEALALATPAPPMPELTTQTPLDPAMSAFASITGAETGSGGSGAGSGSGIGPGEGGGSGSGLGTGTGPGIGGGIGPGLDGVLEDMRRRGLDVVFVIDATDSMSPYIEQGKTRLREIVTVVTSLVRGSTAMEQGPAGRTRQEPVRFGLVAFKDYGDEYGIGATRALPITADLTKLQKALDEVAAGGGGDIPEPLDAALRAAADRKMGWNAKRMNVIVLVTDAPAHSLGREAALNEARAFAKSMGGQINVIDVGGVADGERKRGTVLPDLQAIARSGGGSAFLLEDEQAFWRHMIVSIFGQRFESDIQRIIDIYVKSKR